MAFISIASTIFDLADSLWLRITRINMIHLWKILEKTALLPFLP